MDFHQRRRQQFLSERTYQEALPILKEDAEYFSTHPMGVGANEQHSHVLARRTVGNDLFNILCLRYTAGEAIDSLREQLEQVVVAFERHGELLWAYSQDRNAWVFEFDFLDEYCQLIQCVALCYLLHRRDLLPRLARLQDGESGANGGADWLFEELLTYAPMERFESDHLSATKPYEALADALSSEDNGAAIQDMHRYLKRWYKDLAGTGWHDSHKPNEKGEQGGYFGYWSFEAGAAVLLLGIEDDSSLHQYLYYPKDLVAWARQHSSLSDAQDDAKHLRLRCEAGQPCPREGHWFTPAQADSRRFFKSGEVMPEAGGDYGATIWQWDQNQASSSP